MNNKIIRTALALLFVSLLITAPRAQQPAPAAAKQSPEDRIALYQALLDLTNPWTVMCIAAHPDDEDGTSLIVMRRKYGAHTVSLFSTFGEGGQNAIGPELYEEMGAIRARETMAAAEIQGSEPHFLGLKDFGYSKTRDEAFKFWGHEEGLRRMVLEIRKLRPDVIITNHSVTSNDHGQHQATALMVVEAFDAAADPNKFPEQLKDGVTTWQVQRLFVRARGNQAGNDSTSIVTIDPNEKDPIRGVVYAEEALRALQQHATQGPWPKTFAEYATRFRAFSGQQGGTPGQLPMIRYALVREAPKAPRLTARNPTFLSDLQIQPAIGAWLDELKIDGYPLYDSLNERDRVLDHLFAANAKQPDVAANDMQAAQRWTQLKTRLSKALAAAGGIKITLLSGIAIPKSDHVVSIALTNNGSHQANVIDLNEGENVKLAPGDTATVRRHVQTPGDWTINLPLSQHLYNGFSSGLIVRESLRVTIDNHPAFVVSPAIELDVAPPVEIASINPSALIITPQTENTPRVVTLRVLNHGAADAHKSMATTLVVKNPEEQKKINEAPVSIGPKETRELRMTIPLESKRVAVRSKTVHGTSSAAGGSTVTTQEAQPLLRYPKIVFHTTDQSSNEVSIPLVYADARVAPSLRVGYIRGFDFSLPNALNALGVESKELSVDEVGSSDLSKYTSVIVDNRVYESQPALIAVNQKLLDYANAGGTLIVFYHKSNEWNPDERRKRPQLAPYKLILGDERVTDETAPITFIEPDHPLLNLPNKLGQEDFANWIQERGLYYPKDWDPQYHALLQSNDPGEAPLKGGLLVADYGRGYYIYTSMVWYRELRGGIPGAYRMLANMISYGKAGTR